MKKRILILMLTFLLIFNACEKVYDWQENNQQLPVLVVEGRVTNERIHQKVTLSYPAANLNDTFIPVSNAVVAIIAGDQTYLLHADPSVGGDYYTDEFLQGVVGKGYVLYVRLNGKEYTASAYMVPAEPIGKFNYKSCGDGYKAVFSDEGDPYMLELQMDWSGTPDCTNSSSCKASLVHYYLNTIDVNKIFNMPKSEDVCFPAGTEIVRKKYSLTPEYQEFLRTLLTETAWHGGLFDVESGNVITNLSSGAVGYFSASTVISDTVTVQ